MPAKQNHTRSLVLAAMLIALYVALSTLSIRTGNIRITLDSLPIVVAGALLGPLYGLAVGLIGNFFEQLIFFGLMPTTVLWIVADGVRGLIIGWYARKKGYHLDWENLTYISVLAALAVTFINTVMLHLDNLILHGVSPVAIVTASLIWRMLLGVGTTLVITAVLPRLLGPVEKLLRD